ncbi:LysE family translocator [Flavicella sediminum]|uniref:LysE family translocator n=1 Tax=Flavicella sediminum TaxID=2585141 RepID=UPI00111E74F9|nr:LysE family translocator [Flavicella sediminum]
MDSQIILSFIFASVVVTVLPGPDIIYVLTESITKGFKTGFTLAIGLCLGVLIHTMAAATGLSLIIQKSASVFTSLKFLGAGYLLYLAFLAYKEENGTFELETEKADLKYKGIKILKKGFFMNILNPKVSLFFMAFLPNFISPTGISPMLQMLVLGVLFMIQALLIFGLIAMLAGKFAAILKQDHFWKTTKILKTSILLVLAVFLVS